MANDLPSKWATVDAAWGEGRKHLYSPDAASFEFHATEAEERASAEKDIREGAKMVAVLEVKTVFIAKAVEYGEAQ
jgi:hypothetical protein